MAFLTTDDLELFASIDDEKAEQMIADVEALAVLAAPCLAETDELSDAQTAAVKAVLRSAVLRWNEAGSGALQAQTVGGISESYDDRQTRRSMFWPTEITQLQDICGGSSGSSAFSITPYAYPDYTDAATW